MILGPSLERQAEAVAGSHIKRRACRSAEEKADERGVSQETMNRWHQTGAQVWKSDGK